MRQGKFSVAILFYTTIGILYQQSSEKYFNNRRKSIALFIILVYNMSNTN